MGCCLFALASWLSPRLGIVLSWLFWNERTSAAFSTFIVPLLGFIFLPWTTLMFIIAYAPPFGVSGLGWFLVILAFLVDIGSYTSGQRAQSRRRSN
jgi:hypothetical protein